MNDYLDSLLERITEGELSIRPRPVSLYEPVPQGDGLISEMTTDQAGIPAIPQVDGAKEDASIPIFKGAGMPVQSSQASDTVAPPSLRRLPMDDKEQVRSDPVPSPAASPIRQTRFQVEVGFLRGSDQQESGENIESPTMDNGLVFADVAPEEAMVEKRPLNRAPNPREETARGSEVQVVSATAPILPQTVPLAPLPDSAQIDQIMDTADVPVIPPSSSVNVHIGRIEIRMARQPAVVPSSHKPAHEQRKPVMSLDHYLKLRSEEKL